jgi:large subunit ribosomal protein L32e
LRKRFLPREHKKRKKLKNSWRKPKGHHSKARRKERHAPKMPGFGYRTPKAERKEIKVVHNLQELKESSGTVQIARRVGLKKKLEMLKAAEKLKVRVSNVKLETLKKRVDAKLKPKKEEKPPKKKPEKKKATEKKAVSTVPKKKDAKTSKEPTAKKPAKKPAKKTATKRAGRGR